MYNGILLLDKPYMWTSRFSLNKISYLFNCNNLGCSGILDPISTGILPILFGKYKCKSKDLSESNKVYDVIAYIGIKTNTYDSEGIILKNVDCNININKDYILSMFKNFYGNIKQYSPIYSNVRYLGNRSYKYAISNINIINIPRYVTIYNIKFIYIKNNFLRFIVTCSFGTYIRSLVNDIGNYIGYGAYVYYLRRIKIKNFDEKNLLTFNYILKMLKYYNFNKNKIINKLFINY